MRVSNALKKKFDFIGERDSGPNTMRGKYVSCRNWNNSSKLVAALRIDSDNNIKNDNSRK